MVKLAKGNIIAKENQKNLSYGGVVEQKITALFSKYPNPKDTFLKLYFVASVEPDGPEIKKEFICACWSIWDILRGIEANENDIHKHFHISPSYFFNATEVLLNQLIRLLQNDCDVEGLKFLIDLHGIFYYTKEGNNE